MNGSGATSWLTGNLHTHTLNSDGDTSPGEVAHWYRDHGYGFLVISDHNYRTEIDQLQAELDREAERFGKDRMLLIPGEELTDRYESAERRFELHVNGIDTEKRVGPQGGESVVEVLDRLVDGVRQVGGLPSLNHPNYRWSITVDDLLAMAHLTHFEIYNGHPRVHNLGGGGRPGVEEMWDVLLSSGRRVLGIGVDDAHHFQEWGPHLANPGRGWVMVQASFDRLSIRQALEEGAFYVTTGVELAEVDRRDGALRVRIEPSGDFRYRTEFVSEGQVVSVREDLEVSLSLPRGQSYLRARVVDSMGKRAWTQPIFGAD